MTIALTRRHLLGHAAAGATALLALQVAGCRTTALLSLPGKGNSSNATDILRRIRENEGLTPLVADRTLEKAAKEQAVLMARAGKMNHTTGSGQDFLTRVRRNGIDGAAAENIARGRFDMEGLFLAWMNSSGHRRNMLDDRFTRFGLASAEASEGGRYWALIVAR